ncbi:MAG: magnesium transporter [Acholeplasmatales bacterium]|nr:MAG: magnesium transporter [Acholeplasmatales bacterium]
MFRMSKTSHAKHDAILSIIQQASPRMMQEQLSAHHPSDVADVFMTLGDTERAFVIMSLNFHQLAALFIHMDASLAARQVALLNPDKAAHVFEVMPPDDVAHILHGLSKAARGAIYEHLDPNHAQALQALTTYKKSTAGALMTSDCVILPGDTTTAEALRQIAHDANVMETIHRIYVAADNRFLEGVVELRALIGAEASTPLSDLMHTDMITVQVADRLDYVIHLIHNYQINQLPVVNSQFCLLGVITMDDAAGVLWRQSRRTYAVQGGLSTKMPLGVSMSRRIFWMGFLGALALMLSVLVATFSPPPTTLIALFVVWPLILGLTGQAILQTQTVTVHALQNQQLPDGRSRVARVLTEWAINSLNGLFYSLVLVGLMLLAGRLVPFEALDVAFAGLAGATLFVGMSCAGLMGSLVPILLYRYNIRPIWASGHLLRGLMDVPLTIGLFWAVSTWL